MLRKMVRVDEARCAGRGDCSGSCPGEALTIVGGEARQAEERSGAAVPVRDEVVAVDGSIRQARGW